MWEFCAGLENQPKPGLDMKLVTKKRESSVKHSRGWGFRGNGFIYFLKYFCFVFMRYGMIIHKVAHKNAAYTKNNGPPEIISTNCTHQEHSTYYLLNYLAIYKTNFSEILTT